MDSAPRRASFKYPCTFRDGGSLGSLGPPRKPAPLPFGPKEKRSMAITLTYPGVYIEEPPGWLPTISGVATSIGAFVDFFPKALSIRR
jgi:hypothetical protein